MPDFDFFVHVTVTGRFPTRVVLLPSHVHVSLPDAGAVFAPSTLACEYPVEYLTRTVHRAPGVT